MGFNSSVGLGSPKAISNPKTNEIIQGNISNVFTRKPMGLVKTGGGLSSTTFHVLTNAPAGCNDFTHVRALLLNSEATAPGVTGLIFGVTDTATTFAAKTQPKGGNTITNDAGVTGWVQGTKGGASTWTLPSRNSSTTGDYGSQWTDWVEIHSLPPVDGSPTPYIMVRSKLTATFTYMQPTFYNTNNAQQNYWESFSYVGDGVTTPSNFTTPAANDQYSQIFAIEFKSSNGVVRTICVGDSITQGLHTSAGLDSVDPQARSWVPIAYEALSANNVPINMINYGHSGWTTTQYALSGKSAITNHNPSIALYSVYSPNDGTPTQAMADAMYARAIDFAQFAMSNNCLPIFTFLAPNENINGAADAFRVALIAKVKSKGFRVIDMTTVTAQGSNPQTFVSAYKYDTLHPNLAGHTAMAPLVVSELNYLLSRNLSW